MGEPGETPIDVDLTEIGLRRFTSIEDARRWCKQEQDYWTWLGEIRDVDGNDVETINEIRARVSNVYNPISSVLSKPMPPDEASRSNHVEQIRRVLKGVVSKRTSIIMSDSADAKFLDGLREENPKVAAYAAAALMESRVFPQSAARRGLEGAFLAYAHKHGFVNTTKSLRESFESLHGEWRDLLSEGQATRESAAREYHDLGERASQQLGLQTSRFDEFHSRAEEEFKTLVEKSEEELRNIEHTYDEKLALQAAVRYWKRKAAIHSRRAKALRRWTVAIGIVVLSVLCLETYGVLGPLQELGDVPVWKIGMLLLTAVLGVWFLRILVRLLLSNLHLESDAVERRTMLLTYLSLLRRGDGPDEKQRGLILRILFRPSATGIVKDDALPPVVAKWLNLVTAT